MTPAEIMAVTVPSLAIALNAGIVTRMFTDLRHVFTPDEQTRGEAE